MPRKKKAVPPSVLQLLLDTEGVKPVNFNLEADHVEALAFERLVELEVARLIRLSVAKQKAADAWRAEQYELDAYHRFDEVFEVAWSESFTLSRTITNISP